MTHAKFVLLHEAIAATEASNLICRVVASKTAPLLAAAPFNTNRGADTTLTMAIPKCSAPIRLSDFMSIARSQGVASQVSHLLDFQGLHREEQTILLECRMVKRYLLPDPDNAFRNLMRSDDYSKDVRALLEQCIDRQGYFVTGFLTATDDSWLIEATQQELHQFGIDLPYSDSTDVPVPFLYHDLLGPELALFSQPCAQPPKFVHEQIFAVSYKVARLPQAMSPVSPMSAGQLSPVATTTAASAPRRPKRSNGYHLTSRRTEEVWMRSNMSSPEMTPYYDDGVKLTEDDSMSPQEEEAAFIMV
ncbi:hypothetical protein ISF_07227 [Cordyceps fumosorosea ARSEF 2679]|uniref:Uncharacterized protein n=1 Tax=Cordyceps fumosorosea (strain ARSEF 2679) TaxID=1081104 RepID=A0A167Q5A5_CORFA|nr:hypothetical protein ISF_07227 [Cordyceps fumosorosea ARSEF 2679]OAA57306.1 hypothetical protein ISF_07227 [Cordyceps fumosorosea ARSEF 2679]